MSDLTVSELSAHDWSALTVAKLRLLESKCVDSDLFCVGYLIPLVELVELEHTHEAGPIAQWHQRYRAFVDTCLSTDKIQADDATRITELVNGLAS